MEIISLHSTLVLSLFLPCVPFLGARYRQIQEERALLKRRSPFRSSWVATYQKPLREDYLQRTSAEGMQVI